MGKDLKYGQVTTEHGDIGEDEPVVVFRAQDALLPILLDHYREMCGLVNAPAHHIDLIHNTRSAVLYWQATHPTQFPRSDSLDPDKPDPNNPPGD
jgi:hypothetical protein